MPPMARFHSCTLDETRLWTALRYVERNPVRAKMVRRAWDYEWSSAAAHVSGDGDLSLAGAELWPHMSKGMDWATLLNKPEDEDALPAIRLRTRTGRPLGSDTFLSKLEAAVGRRLRPLPVGRPEKPKSSERRRGRQER